ncbi:MAG: alpha/beta hydrolase [Burkholderiaceae bacterium]|nr:alpha/beta hydrolase [Burkholderiaceae bacterium]
MTRPEFTVVRRVALPNGVQLEIAEQGARDGVPVVLLHGITDSRLSYEPMWQQLPKHWHTIAVSVRGHGESDRPPHYALADIAGDVALLAEALQLQPMVVVGHSMGAAVAMQLAIDRPDLVRALVGIGAFASFGDKPDLRAYRDTEIEALRDPIPDGVAREFQVSTLAGPLDATWLEMMVRESRKVPARVWRAAFDGLLADSFCAGLPTLTMPVLLLWGSADAFVPRADQDRLRSVLPAAELQVYDGVGHAVHWEQPTRVTQDLQRFVDALAARGAPRRSPGLVAELPRSH